MTRATAIVRVKHAWAYLDGPPMALLDSILAFDDPDKEDNAAYVEQRWDGKVRLYEGRRFPAGFLPEVTAMLEAEGYAVRVSGFPKGVVDVADLTPDYMRTQNDQGKLVPMWGHVVRMIRALVSCRRGVIYAPTSSGKTSIEAGTCLKLFCDLGYKSVIVVPKVSLMHQTRKALEASYADIPIKVGFYGDGMRVPGDVTVATAQTLMNYKTRYRIRRGTGMRCRVEGDAELRALLVNADVLVFDEVHHVSADTWYDIGMNSKAKRIYGLSGTPFRNDDLADAKLRAVCGPVVGRVEDSELSDLGLICVPKVCMVAAENASHSRIGFNPRINPVGQYRKGGVAYADAYLRGVVNSERHNAAVLLATQWLVDHHRQTLLLVRRIPHMVKLAEMLEQRGITYAAVYGDAEAGERIAAKRSFSTRRVRVLLATTVFDEGESVHAVEAIVLAEGVKSPINIIQRVGRGKRREAKSGVSDVWVVDFAPLCHPTLANHAIHRIEAMEREGYVTRLVEAWPNPDEELSDEDYTNLLPFLDWTHEAETGKHKAAKAEIAVA